MHWSHAAYLAALCVLTIYAVLKERMENGCKRVSIDRQCIDDHSVFLVDAVPSAGDAPADSVRKLVACLSFHEKAAVWRKCVLLSNAYAFVVVMFLWDVLGRVPVERLVLMHVVFLAIMYFFFNYMNFHYHRRLKEHGVRHLGRILEACRGGQKGEEEGAA